MPHKTIFQLYCGGQCHWWRKPEYKGEKDLSQVTDKHAVIMSLLRYYAVIVLLYYAVIMLLCLYYVQYKCVL
jgi:hypothetical protein